MPAPGAFGAGVILVGGLGLDDWPGSDHSGRVLRSAFGEMTAEAPGRAESGRCESVPPPPDPQAATWRTSKPAARAGSEAGHERCHFMYSPETHTSSFGA